MLIWWLIAASVVLGVMVITIFGEITKEKISITVGEQSSIKGKELHARIKEIQSDTVRFSMYDRNGNHVQDVKMKSTDNYVSSKIKVGDTIY